jgi:DNA-binding Xre family transcriptional regulator
MASFNGWKKKKKKQTIGLSKLTTYKIAKLMGWKNEIKQTIGLSKSATHKIAKFFGWKKSNQANHWAMYV